MNGIKNKSTEFQKDYLINMYGSSSVMNIQWKQMLGSKKKGWKKEVVNAVRMMKNCEILDTDGIMFKYTCGLIMDCLCEVYIPIYSSKGNKNECKNTEG